MSKITFDRIQERLASRRPLRSDAAGRREAAVALVLAEGGGEGPDILLIKRAEKRGDPWSGQMGLPGGRREPDDRALLETAVRETREETGIDLTRETCLGELDDLAPTTPVLPPVLVRPFVFGLPSRPDAILSSEVDRLVWTPLLGLKTLEGESEVTVAGARLSVPAYRIGPHVVWGMTHRILKPFIEFVS